MKVVFLGVALALVASTAHAATIEVGPAFGALEPYINALVTAAVIGIVGFLAWAAQKWLGVQISDSMRDALHTFLQRQASSLVADGAVRVNGLRVEVKSDLLAAAANAALTAIPDTLKFFGLTPEKVQEMIVDKIPNVPAVASAQAASVSESAAGSVK